MTPQLYVFSNSLKSFIRKHHAVMFITFLCIVTAIAIFSLYQVFIIATDRTSDTATSSIGGFDKTTADKIKKLRVSSDKSEPLTFPESRHSPFAE